MQERYNTKKYDDAWGYLILFAQFKKHGEVLLLVKSQALYEAGSRSRPYRGVFRASSYEGFSEK